MAKDKGSDSHFDVGVTIKSWRRWNETHYGWSCMVLDRVTHAKSFYLTMRHNVKDQRTWIGTQLPIIEITEILDGPYVYVSPAKLKKCKGKMTTAVVLAYLQLRQHQLGEWFDDTLDRIGQAIGMSADTVGRQLAILKKRHLLMTQQTYFSGQRRGLKFSVS